MSKDDYILRSLSKIGSKRTEHFVINRIYHRLNDPEIEFICQQLVRRPTGYALTDLYFPQLSLHLEIDEPHHAANVELDNHRSRDIVEATRHRIERIAAFDTENPAFGLGDLTLHVDAFVDLIRVLKDAAISNGTFRPWDYDLAFSPLPHIARGYIDATENVVMRYQRDVLQCFGYQGGHYQRGIWRYDTDLRRIIWFPRLWNQAPWSNWVSDDGTYIFEDAGDQIVEGYRVPDAPDFVDERIVFAKWHDPLGLNVYRFTGVFRKCVERSTGKITAFVKVADRFQLPAPRNT